MANSETRFINQCTYTPITVKEVDSKKYLGIPFEKWMFLAIIFTSPALMECLLKYVYEFLTKPEYNLPPESSINLPPVSSINQMENAAKLMWQGEVYSAIEILREVDVAEVIALAEGALKIEEKLFSDSLKDLDKAFDSLSRQAEETEAVGELRQEMDMLRQEVNLMRREISTSIQERESPQQAVPISTSLELQPIAELERAPRTIALGRLEQYLEAESQQSAMFLESIQVFPIRRERFEFATKSFLQDASMVPVAYAMASESRSIPRKKQSVESHKQRVKGSSPAGFLHLERMQFTPIGYQRGELVYSLPLLPKETVRLSHREWSRTEREFEEIVSRTIESSSEEALSEKSELAQSTDTQQQHSSAHELDVHAEGSYGTFKITTDYGFDYKESEQKSRKSSAKRSQDITKKAASRSKKDHKVTFKVTTEYEVEEESFREITNQSNEAIRWDYHRLMKKWRIDLYRYDARLTYDIVIPAPGSYLLRKHIFLKAINNELEKPMEFNLSPLNINPVVDPLKKDSWITLQKEYGVTLPRPPQDTLNLSFSDTHAYEETAVDVMAFIELNLPQGYMFKDWTPHGDTVKKGDKTVGALNELKEFNNSRLEGGAKNSTRFSWKYYYGWSESTKPTSGDMLTILIDVTAERTQEHLLEWKIQCYEKLLDAARAKYESKRQRLINMRDELLEELNQEDTLMLRNLEKEELMKSVVRWLLGPSFSFYPRDLLEKLPEQKDWELKTNKVQFIEGYGPLSFYEDGETSGNKKVVRKLSLQDEDTWNAGLKYGEFIKFIHQALEWENVNYVLYPYFWSEPDKERWDFIQSLFHTDHVHRAFLRAGAARVVIPVRPGFEKNFLAFTEGYFEEAFKNVTEKGLKDVLDEKHPYITIAQELENRAETHYPYTPDANMEIEEYLFSWNKVTEEKEGSGQKGEHNERLKEVLSDDFYVGWINAPQPQSGQKEKTDDKAKVIVVIEKIEMPEKKKEIIIVSRKDIPSKPGGVAEITLDTQKETEETAVLKISDNRTYNLSVKKEGDDYKLYKKLNWIDTWHEFTPTSALDVVKGEVLS